jgi:hypothetical protein
LGDPSSRTLKNAPLSSFEIDLIYISQFTHILVYVKLNCTQPKTRQSLKPDLNCS